VVSMLAAALFVRYNGRVKALDGKPAAFTPAERPERVLNRVPSEFDRARPVFCGIVELAWLLFLS
jgi:hypothetical protein